MYIGIKRIYVINGKLNPRLYYLKNSIFFSRKQSTEYYDDRSPATLRPLGRILYYYIFTISIKIIVIDVFVLYNSLLYYFSFYGSAGARLTLSRFNYYNIERCSDFYGSCEWSSAKRDTENTP